MNHYRCRDEPPGVVLTRVVGYLAATLPGMSAEEAHSVLVKAGAHTRKGLRQLDDYFAARPDALIAGHSGCPAAFVRLARVLIEAGHVVSPPVCAACGRPGFSLRADPEGRVCSRCYARKQSIACARCGLAGRPAARRPEGVICYRCYARDPEAVETCAGCGRLRLPAMRQDDGRALCSSCCPRSRRVCAKCGVVGPVKVTREEGPICESCYRSPERLCGRCGRIGPIARRATENSPDLCPNCYQGVLAACSVCGRVRPCQGSRSGTFICKSCLPRRKRACCRCGRMRPVNAEWPIGPVCSTCYEHIRGRPSTCAKCGGVQPLIATDDHGQRICGPCAGVAVEYNCRRCGLGGRIYADGTCGRCVLADRLDDLLQRANGSTAPPLKPVRDALVAVEHPASIIGWLRKSASARLLAQLAAEDRPITHELLDQLPQEKSLHNVRQILVHTGVLSERLEYLERLGPWLEELLSQMPNRHARLIRPFAHWFVFRRARRASQRRPYTEAAASGARGRIRVAASFLTWLDDHHLDLQTLSQADLDRWLTSGSTPRYEVHTLLRWAANRALAPKLTVPQRSFRQPPGNLPNEHELSRQLQRCLTDEALPADIRAAGALVVLFGLPVSKAVQLTADHLTDCGQATYLTMDQQPVLIPPRLAEVLRLAASTPSRSALGRSLPGRQWLFPGFSPGRHQAPGALRPPRRPD